MHILFFSRFFLFFSFRFISCVYTGSPRIRVGSTHANSAAGCVVLRDRSRCHKSGERENRISDQPAGQGEPVKYTQDTERNSSCPRCSESVVLCSSLGICLLNFSSPKTGTGWCRGKRAVEIEGLRDYLANDCIVLFAPEQPFEEAGVVLQSGTARYVPGRAYGWRFPCFAVRTSSRNRYAPQRR